LGGLEDGEDLEAAVAVGEWGLSGVDGGEEGLIREIKG